MMGEREEARGAGGWSTKGRRDWVREVHNVGRATEAGVWARWVWGHLHSTGSQSGEKTCPRGRWPQKLSACIAVRLEQGRTRQSVPQEQPHSGAGGRRGRDGGVIRQIQGEGSALRAAVSSKWPSSHHSVILSTPSFAPRG